MADAKTETTDRDSSAHGSLSPFRHRAFAVLWTATVVSNVGTWMNDVGAGWLMTTLAPSPLLVSLVQAATALPVFLFALPAGALADLVDRRRMLLLVQILMAVAAGGFAALVWFGTMMPWLLLLFTALLGTGAAFTAPAWQAIVPALVPRPLLQPAVAMNSVGINVSRAIGPAVSGFLIAAFGIAAPFIVNTVSFLGVIAALLWWRSDEDHRHDTPREHLLGAMGAGLRFAASSPPLRATLARAVVFFLFASAYWALMPLIARQELAGGPTLYGLMLGAVGAGAVGGAFLLPALKARMGADALVAAGTAGTALVLVLFAVIQTPAVAILASALAGVSWIAVLTNLNVSAQMALPNWVRARGLSIFVTVFFGSMTLGSVIWGQIAALSDIPAALLIAAGGALLGIPLTWRLKLQQGAGLDLSPSMHWPAPAVAGPVAPDRGPVLILVEYRIDPDQSERFLKAIAGLADARRRHGAYRWGVYEDAADPGRYLEHFQEGSWAEHLRHHERVSGADRVLQEAVLAFHQGQTPPVVQHFLAPPS